MKLVQEIEIGYEHGDKFIVTLGERELYLHPSSGDSIPISPMFLNFSSNEPNFFNDFFRALENSDIATTFEPLPTP